MSSTADTLDLFFFFFNDTAPPEIYPLSLHDALPISRGGVLAWLVGPGRLSAQRVVAGEPAVIDRALGTWMQRSEEHTSELQSQSNLVCRLLLEKKKKNNHRIMRTLLNRIIYRLAQLE